MSDESRRYTPMLRQANILQPATVEAMREANLKADYRLISELLRDRSFIRSWRKTRLETECSFPITRSTATKVIYMVFDSKVNDSFEEISHATSQQDILRGR